MTEVELVKVESTQKNRLITFVYIRQELRSFSEAAACVRDEDGSHGLCVLAGKEAALLAPRRPGLYAELLLTASSAASDSVMERLLDGSPDRPIDWLSYRLFVKVMN